MNGSRRLSLAALAALLIYVLLFVALSIDVMVRVWDRRDRFDSPVDAGVLLLFEGIRSVVIVSAVGAVVISMSRARESVVLLRLGWATAFAAIAYAIVMAFTGFPGAAQERVATSLISAGTPRWLLQVLFGRWEWAAWLAIGGFVIVAACWPRRITAADVRASGTQDRAGAMRSVAVAGADVGSLLRGWTAWLLENGWIEPCRVWLLAGLAAVVHTALLLTQQGSTALAAQVLALAGAASAGAVGVTLFRAGSIVADAAQLRFVDWLRRGALSALALFAVSAAASLAGAGFVAASAMLLAPAAFFACVARAAAVSRA